MEIAIITREDLLKFKMEVVQEIREVIEGKIKSDVDREWLKSSEVRKILKVSPGTLQNLRINGTLPYRKIGGSMYYRLEDLKKLMNGDK
ncbi:helix-turn-helix domain-containing protein [Pedobacter sp. ISL-68]|uniref:helix-turn-helix domain-containing protein n=1 Tax=unclassified Pedobacter TaxID=2628915 RepID=UPI001BE605AA|nr:MULTISPECIES: helix-turn-helix domain-containing protein [unclassified Pedobacter]MBT2559869.1 helix-turn-helix domain-containing protein [Pedobacter sp. ISL-64]MBT2592174.1 helix-turn-helix domain-containing protein [Pedobacter sp. ISL-68]